VKRLRSALAVTRTLISVDAVLPSMSRTSKGSGAGEGGSDHRELTLCDTLSCPEPPPEHFVELSILRQCLENAMASELSPYERDIIRLRLGLDDGKTRTAREVAEFCGGVVSQDDVRTTEKKAFKKLRSPNTMHAHTLYSFLDQRDALGTYVNQRYG